MKRLIYNEDTQALLEELTEGNKCYWRYQGDHHNGIIPVGQQSHERIFEGEAPEYVEEGVSCYDNPLQLFQYMQSDFAIDMDKTDVVLFIGKHMGYGLDEEDIVMVEEESDCMYSLSAKDFYKFLANADIYYNNINIKECYIENCGMEF
ncbi:hypothetical protein [Clostridium neonatale]|uniref:hypothetical protein n=1 Tax=Clostridium neonatale TaxID=137838 RepID=UPI00291B651F|nr:hypothetical protein [Clostridium neonatale]CAI3193052.1 hypothetical protein CNEO2_130106 [Clostridium neonatale]CAI3197046.1 hypothetical protein CNEO2_160035 [Clostridium neonatale]